MKKFNLFMVLLALFFQAIQSGIAQNNLVNNPGFETARSGTTHGVPHNYHQGDSLAEWETKLKIRTEDDQNGIEQKIPLHSPDWYKNGTTFVSGVGAFQHLTINEVNTFDPIPANSGLGFIGMRNCELIQQKFHNSNKIKEGQEYRLRMYVRPGNYISTWAGTAQLKVRLKKNDLEYSFNANKLSSYCTNDYCDHENENTNNTQVILNIPVTLAGYPMGQWYEVTTTFIAPSDAFDWFIIETEEPSSNCDTYLLIDDVSLIRTCELGCSRTGGIIEPVFSATNTNWWHISNLDNVSHAEIKIYSLISSALLRTINVSSTNGITNPIYWDGKNNNGSPLVTGTYLYVVSLTNECGTENFSDSFTHTHLTNVPPPPTFTYNTSGVKTPKPCCEDIIYINNQVLTGELEYIAGSKVIAGNTGNVTVSNGANVLFQAGEEIALLDFGVEEGAEFAAVTEPCSRSTGSENEDEGIPQYIENLSLSENTAKSTEYNNQVILPKNNVDIFPNPNNGSFTLSIFSENQPSSDVFVYDVFGKVVYQTSNVTNPILNIDISGQVQGIYLVRVQTGNEQFLKKVVMQSDLLN